MLARIERIARRGKWALFFFVVLGWFCGVALSVSLTAYILGWSDIAVEFLVCGFLLAAFSAAVPLVWGAPSHPDE